jgi:hypothetical protein
MTFPEAKLFSKEQFTDKSLSPLLQIETEKDLQKKGPLKMYSSLKRLNTSHHHPDIKTIPIVNVEMRVCVLYN